MNNNEIVIAGSIYFAESFQDCIAGMIAELYSTSLFLLTQQIFMRNDDGSY